MNSVSITPPLSSRRRRKLLREYFLNALTLALLKEGEKSAATAPHRSRPSQRRADAIALPG